MAYHGVYLTGSSGYNDLIIYRLVLLDESFIWLHTDKDMKVRLLISESGFTLEISRYTAAEMKLGCGSHHSPPIKCD